MNDPVVVAIKDAGWNICIGIAVLAFVVVMSAMALAAAIENHRKMLFDRFYGKPDADE